MTVTEILLIAITIILLVMCVLISAIDDLLRNMSGTLAVIMSRLGEIRMKMKMKEMNERTR